MLAIENNVREVPHLPRQRLCRNTMQLRMHLLRRLFGGDGQRVPELWRRVDRASSSHRGGPSDSSGMGRSDR